MMFFYHYIRTTLCWPVWVIMRVANSLVPNRCQDISNHHSAYTVIIVSHVLYIAIRITLQPWTNFVWGRFGGRQSISFFITGRFAFSWWLVSRILPDFLHTHSFFITLSIDGTTSTDLPRYRLHTQYTLCSPYITVSWHWRINQRHPIACPCITVTSSWVWWHPKSAVSIVWELFVQVQIKENIKALHHWPLWGESTGDWWIPLTKGQWHRKCFNLMTSSWGRGMGHHSCMQNLTEVLLIIVHSAQLCCIWLWYMESLYEGLMTLPPKHKVILFMISSFFCRIFTLSAP